MVPRLPSSLSRILSSSAMSRVVARALPLATNPSALTGSFRSFSKPSLVSFPSARLPIFSSGTEVFCPGFYGSWRNPSSPRRLFAGCFASLRGFRKARGRPTAKKQPPKEKELELIVRICIEEELPDDPELLNIAEMLRLDSPMAMKIAFDGLKDWQYKTRDTAIDDVGNFEKVELSVLLCNDDFMRKLNKDWRDEDHATDVLSMSQHIPGIELPILMLGDIVISVETAARQAEERGHALLDEIRILMVHGLLHLLGFDHEISDEAEAEMEKEEELVLHSLGWKGKGLIQSAYDAIVDGKLKTNTSDGQISNESNKERSLRFYRPKFSYIFCDMDGTLLNSKSEISPRTAEALREAMSRGVKIVIATGKSRAAVISAFRMVDLVGKGGVVSESSPGVFLQGLLVYGRQGRELFRRNLDPDVCREALLYSWEKKIPLIAFSQDRCLTLFDHPLVDSLHTIFHEPKAEIIPSVEHLLAAADIQKLLFYDTAQGVASTLRPYWATAIEGRAGVVQAQPDMLEIIPVGTSKGSGVKLLLDHLGTTAEEVMAIGDGENDVEMLQLASLGVALANGADEAKAVANVIGVTNDEDGAADAIYRYAF
ncbi:endoribonuclease YBEY, chloroplastic [Aristolochia californica]|uniref:endoribonuclease YBEY, chloroplastic n=1 Tax=Aristolochia californica TaxID=171875 RepID=UPI0035D7C414